MAGISQHVATYDHLYPVIIVLVAAYRAPRTADSDESCCY